MRIDSIGSRTLSTGRVPPYSIEAEMSVLGAMMLGSNNAVERAIGCIGSHDFYRDAHALIFTAMTMLFHRKEPVDIITLQNEMAAIGTLEGIGIEYLLQLSDIEFTTSNLEYYAAIVREKSIKRQLIEAGSAMAALGYADDDTPAADLVRLSERKLSEINTIQGKTNAVTLYEAMTSTLESIKAAQGTKGITGITFGLIALDDMTTGMQKSELNILAARPGMGKTSLMTKAAYSAAKTGKVTAVFSLEMSKEQLCRREYASMARVNGQRIRNAMLSSDDLYRMEEARLRCLGLPIEIIDQTEIKASEMQSECRRIKAKYGTLDLVVVDYLLLMGQHENLNRNATIREQVTANTRAMKHLARHFNCPVLLLTQLSRSCEKRDDKRPILSDLAESGAIEAEADAVLFLYRPQYYDKSGDFEDGTDDQTEPCEVIIGKNRNGPTGFVQVAFQPSYVRFDDLYEGTF